MHTNISLQQLRYIIEVAECGSINAASQQLYVSQPTLSTTIKDTEQELGISIFNRQFEQRRQGQALRFFPALRLLRSCICRFGRGM